MNINLILYAYMYICIALLVYSIIYTSKATLTRKMNHRRSLYWQKSISRQLTFIQEKKPVEKKHYKKLKRKLMKTKELLSYVDALESFYQDDVFQKYLHDISPTLLTLSIKYINLDNMNKTIFAYMITQYPIFDQNYSLIQTLLGYLENSTLYTREYVLDAIYALGSVDGVERALQMMNDYNYFHHKKMISTGLVTFRGNHEELMKRLCHHFYDWNENIMVSVVEYMSKMNAQYQEELLSLLTSQSISIEIKLAILRYFRKNHYDAVLPVLYDFMENKDTDINMVIVSASTLESYPCQKTYEVLKKAICHHNWYVRYNAAYALVALNVDIHQLKEVIQGKDRFASEILNYMLQKKGCE